MIAEYERAKIMERSRRGKQHARPLVGQHVLSAPHMDIDIYVNKTATVMGDTRSWSRRLVWPGRSSSGSAGIIVRSAR
jgi:hypothetical protein